ncbi:MAG TPA: 1-deoxy-D-xylulose-5-phosphate reductoisomerase [Terriglobia bacterium]|nr:1-deoxy-D-xylulose-5-phosphate reductoisomerase [Terriglobia bacterium]
MASEGLLALIKGLCILGSTGSIGRNCLNVVRGREHLFRVVALSAGRNLDLLASQIAEFRPCVAVVYGSDSIAPLRERLQALGFRENVKILAGTEGQVEAVSLPEVNFVVAASHGTTGLAAVYEAICAGKTVGLANKEVMVVAGELVTRTAQERGVDVLPIDSEHCAIHQCLRSGARQEVKRLILTGSGGPFLKTPRKDLDSVTPDQALNHPVWKMGGRITIDSATLMNKGLEIIEARWLFGFPSQQIDVMIHPESIIHSMIEFCDGSVMAQLGVADMRLPIQYALTYPERMDGNGYLPLLDLIAAGRLHFRAPDVRRFPCLELGRAALEQGGVMPCALNAADEVAVEAFLRGELRFPDIPRVIEKVMGEVPESHPSTMQEVLESDTAARAVAREAVALMTHPTTVV